MNRHSLVGDSHTVRLGSWTARRPGPRIVTCGGKFDERRPIYLDNVVVLATLVSGGERE